MPSGEFMELVPLTVEHAREAPDAPGRYLIYLDDEPYYAGLSRRSIRARLSAHATGRGSKKIAVLLASTRSLSFEFYDVTPELGEVTDEDIQRLEFFFMAMHEGKLLPGNLRADGARLFGRADPCAGVPASPGQDADVRAGAGSRRPSSSSPGSAE